MFFLLPFPSPIVPKTPFCKQNEDLGPCQQAFQFILGLFQKFFSLSPSKICKTVSPVLGSLRLDTFEQISNIQEAISISYLPAPELTLLDRAGSLPFTFHLSTVTSTLTLRKKGNRFFFPFNRSFSLLYSISKIFHTTYLNLFP